MLTQFDFAVLQMRYIKGVITEIPSYKPDGKDGNEAMSMIAVALIPRAAYVTQTNNITGARAARRTGIELNLERC